METRLLAPTGVAFLTFAGTVLFHIIQGVTCHHITSVTWQQVCSCLVPREQHEDARAGSEEPLLQFSDGELSEVAQPLLQVVHYDQYREPVFEYEDDKKSVCL